MNIRCFVCGTPAGTLEQENSLLEMDNATIWISGGNYGSTVLDGDAQLYMFICDTCLQKKASRTLRLEEKIVKSSTFHEWKPNT